MLEVQDSRMSDHSLIQSDVQNHQNMSRSFLQQPLEALRAEEASLKADQDLLLLIGPEVDLVLGQGLHLEIVPIYQLNRLELYPIQKKCWK